MSSPLTYICNKMIPIGTFPTRLKFSEIQRLFKKDDKTQISNYRHIPLAYILLRNFRKYI